MKLPAALTVLVLAGCPEPSPAQSDAAPAPAAEPAPDPVPDPAPEPKAAPAPAPEASPAPEPGPPFDPATATEATVEVTRIVAVPGGACGVLHIVGAIEVEVLDAGEPRPKLGLYVSCPNDLQPRGMLEIGKRLRATFHRRAQSWPKPATRHDAGLTVRYVRSLTVVTP